MEFFKKNISSIIAAVIVIAAILFFYAPMFAYQEGLQIFMLNSEFFSDTCLRPGGLSDYIGCFLVQFFMYTHWLVIILTLLIVGFLALTKSIFKANGVENGLADVLSVVCAAGMIAAATNFNVLFSGLISILLATTAVKFTKYSKNIILLTSLTPLVYFITGGFGAVIYITGVTIGFSLKKSGVFLAVNALVLTFSVLFVKNIMQDDSLTNTFFGVDFNRYPENQCTVWFSQVFLVLLSFGLSVVIKNIKKIFQYAVYGITTICLSIVMIMQYDSATMLFYKIDKMVRYKQWDSIIKSAEKQNFSSPLTLCYLNLALNEKGIMDSKMFNFPQIGPQGLSSSEINAQNKSIVNCEIYFRLGLVNIAERLSIDAMESCNTFQKSARQYKRLAEIAIIKNDKPLAIRYLKKLQATTFYRAWALKALKYINNPEKNEGLSDWKIKPLEIKYDFFFSPSYKSELFYYLFGNEPHNRKLFNYYVCHLLLEKDINTLYNFIMQSNLLEQEQANQIGTHVYEGILLYLKMYRPNDFQKGMSDNNNLTERYKEYLSKGTKNNYWFYYDNVQ
ncbi:MAG: hypothetical protein IIU11_06835 [Bacteroidales bacterium]|nr:hypothetical protein [Bacteroidales bacterium]